MGVAFLPVRPSEKNVLLVCVPVPKKGRGFSFFQANTV